MKLLLGPVLGFRSCPGNAWNCCALFVFDQSTGVPSELQWSQNGAEKVSTGIPIFRHGDAEVWVYEIPAVCGAVESTVTYHLPDGIGPVSVFTVPAQGDGPRMAYCSCNGFSESKIARDTPEPADRWEYLAAMHDPNKPYKGELLPRARPFHLLLMGGDQVYADHMWETVSELNKWAHKWRWQQVRAGFNQAMEAGVRRHFFEVYTTYWAMPEPAGVLASIPTIMMWDDHDITDGYGSHPDNLQLRNSNLAGGGVLPGLFAVAKEFFEVFQLRVAPGNAQAGAIAPGSSNLSSLHQFGSIALLVADLRSERTRDQVVDSGSWARIAAALGTLPPQGAIKHLLVMSSLPVVYPVAGVLGGLTSLIPWDPVTDPQDDLIDQWSHRNHTSEREQLMRLLFEISQTKSIRITLLSGDVHVAGHGVIESDRGAVPPNSNAITQLISSGIVHPPSGGALGISALNLLAQEAQEIYRGVEGRLVPFWPGGPYLLPRRNWLSLLPVENNFLRAQWHPEGMTENITKDIGPC